MSKEKKNRGALAGSIGIEHATLDLRAMHSSPTLGGDHSKIKQKTKTKKEIHPN